MISATLGDFEVDWQPDRVSVRPGLVAEMDADESLIARTRLAAECLRLRAEIERLMTLPAYDRTAFEATDRPFRVLPGSVVHARLVLEGLGAEIEFEDDEADELDALEAELRTAEPGGSRC